MAKFIYLFCIYLFYNTHSSLQEPKESSTNIEILPDSCESLLQLFANGTAKFTLCVVTNARPITVCQNCVNEYTQVLQRYKDIQELSDNKIDCRAILTNIDRLQVVYASYNYVLDMWEKASCKLCLDGMVLNDRTKNVIQKGNFLKSCISNHLNGTTPNSSLCTDCREDYMDLNNYYNVHKINQEFCMDVVDLINSTQADWNLMFKCHVPNYKSEFVLLSISFVVLLMPILFYLINWLMSQERSYALLSQHRQQDRSSNSAASTSG